MAGDWEDYPPATDGAQHTVVGNLKVLRGVESPQLGNRRDVLVYLPPSYRRGGTRRFPVVYMHDGQNLFDQATSFSEEWRVDETLERAAAEEGLEAIVVGIPNMGDERLDEYSPFRDRGHDGGGLGDEYLAFLADTLKPIVDRDFRTRPEREYTGIAGSSMGGLISLYGVFSRSEVFGLAAALSPALWFGGAEILSYVAAAPFAESRIYLDVGTKEGQATVRNARRMRDLLFEKGYDSGHSLRYVEERGASHSESAWAGRLAGALRFLLRP